MEAISQASRLAWPLTAALLILIDPMAAAAEPNSKPPMCAVSRPCAAEEVVAIFTEAPSAPADLVIVVGIKSFSYSQPVAAATISIPQVLSSLIREADSKTKKASSETNEASPINISEIFQQSQNGNVMVKVSSKTGMPLAGPLYQDVSPLFAEHLLVPGAEFSCDPKPCEVGSTVTAKVTGLNAWAQATKEDVNKLQLLVNGIVVGDRPLNLNMSSERVSFELTRASEPSSNDALVRALGKGSVYAGKIKMELATGAEVISSPSEPVEFGLRARYTLLAIIFISLTSLLLWVCWKSKWSVIRDAPPVNDDKWTHTMPFSLGRSQMLAWTFTVPTLYVWTGFSLDDWNGPNATALALLGIGAGTAFGSVAATNWSTVVKAQVDIINNTLPSDPSHETALAQLTKLMPISKNWFSDILSDGRSDVPVLNRLQVMLFTVIFLIYYWCLALAHCTLVDFSVNQLLVLGISAGLYVGFKRMTVT